MRICQRKLLSGIFDLTSESSENRILRGYWSLELIILDENLANQSFKDIIQISQFVELAFSLRNICHILYMYQNFVDFELNFIKKYLKFSALFVENKFEQVRTQYLWKIMIYLYLI